MIRIEGVRVSFDSVTAVSGVDLDIDRGEFLTIVGPSGCGKTTLLHAVAGLQEPTEGRIGIDGEGPGRARDAGRIGLVFQEHTLLPWKTALGNVTFLRRIAGKPPDEPGARRLLDAVGLSGFLEAYPRELSGGMAQRVAIARALHLDADLLLMDEPFGALDEITRDELGVELRDLLRERETTVLFVTHSVPEAVFLGDRCVVLRGTPGRIEGVFDLDLPEPREPSLFTDRTFQERVGEVRAALYVEASPRR